MLLLKISGMDCNHCVESVTGAVKSVAGVTAVTVDLPTGEVHVEGAADRDLLVKAIEKKGYEVVG